MRFKRNPVRAFFYTFVASLTFSLVAMITKILSRTLPSNEIVFFDHG